MKEWLELHKKSEIAHEYAEACVKRGWDLHGEQYYSFQLINRYVDKLEGAWNLIAGMSDAGVDWERIEEIINDNEDMLGIYRAYLIPEGIDIHILEDLQYLMCIEAFLIRGVETDRHFRTTESAVKAILYSDNLLEMMALLGVDSELQEVLDDTGKGINKELPDKFLGGFLKNTSSYLEEVE